jgi:F0F1-type ATP synthase membrane subunit a
MEAQHSIWPLVGSTWVVVGLVVFFAWLGRQAAGPVPRGWAAVFEHIYDWLDGLAQDLMGAQGRRYVPIAMSIFLFLLISNWFGLIPSPVLSGAHPPAAQGAPAGHGEVAGGHGETAAEAVEQQEEGFVLYEAPSVSFSTTLAMALISFFLFNFYGLKKAMFPEPAQHPPGEAHEGHEGQEARPHQEADQHPPHSHPGPLGGFLVWLGHFIQPTPELWRTLEGGLRYIMVPLLCLLFLFLNVVEEVARIISLSIRLYGNIFGEHQAKENLLAAMYGFTTQMFGSFAAGSVAGVGWGFLALLLWASSLFVTCLGALAGFIQAFVFTILTLSYIAHAVAEEH